MKHVVLLDSRARVIGATSKEAAHLAPGKAHLAFSVYLFDGSGNLLVQRRSATKYHFPGVWSNSCCSHPQPSEPVRVAARRRVQEELGVDVTDLSVRGAWYDAVDPHSGLVEVEYDVVLTGTCVAGPVAPAASEVDDIGWLSSRGLEPIPTTGSQWTPWFAAGLRVALGAPMGVRGDFPL